MNIVFVVISAGRASNCNKVEKDLLGNVCVWYVPYNQVESYRKGGAKTVVGVHGNLPMKSIQLNQALEDLSSKYDFVVTLDDDIVKVVHKHTRKEVSIAQCAFDIASSLNLSPYYLGGPYTGLNTSWAPGLKMYGRIPGALMVHKKSGLRFDNSIVGAEDFDYCILHHIVYGGVVLHGDYCLENLWSDNPGGYQDIRNDQNISEVTRLLSKRYSKYGGKFEFDAVAKNKVKYRFPWKKVANYGGKYASNHV